MISVSLLVVSQMTFYLKVIPPINQFYKLLNRKIRSHFSLFGWRGNREQLPNRQEKAKVHVQGPSMFPTVGQI